MDQVVVILITLARIEAHHAVGVPAAVAHKAAQEIVTTRDTVDRAGLWRGKHRLNGLSEFRGDALIGIDHQHVIARGVTLRTLAMNTVALPVGVGKDFCPGCTGNVRRVVRTSGVENDDFVSPGNRGQAIRKQVGGVFGDHHDRQTR